MRTAPGRPIAGRSERVLSDPRDLARLREGVRVLAGLALRPEITAVTDGSVREANAELFGVLNDDAALEEYLLATAGDAQHGTSTCRMGDPR